MQFAGSLTQSVLQRNRCQVSQPMGGVSARPLSNPLTCVCRRVAHTSASITAHIRINIVISEIRF